MGGLRELLLPFRPGSMLILHEAHHAAPSSGTVWAFESQLTRSVREIAALFEHRLFLSATPHNGHSNSFATLLEILDPQRFTRGIDVEAKELEPVMVRRLKEDLRRLGQPFPERIVEPIQIDGLPADAPELRLAAMLDEYRQSSAGGARARFLFANLQQRLFSSIAAFRRTLTTHRKTLLKKRREGEPEETEAEVELLRITTSSRSRPARRRRNLVISTPLSPMWIEYWPSAAPRAIRPTHASRRSWTGSRRRCWTPRTPGGIAGSFCSRNGTTRVAGSSTV
jgi:hypothetical protein